MKKLDETIKSYVEWVEITEEEFNNAKDSMSDDKFKVRYRYTKTSGLYVSKEKWEKAIFPTIEDINYMVAVDTLDELKKLRQSQEECNGKVNSLKNMVLFFVILTVVSLIMSIASVASLSSFM